MTREGSQALQVHWGRTARSRRLREEREASQAMLQALQETPAETDPTHSTDLPGSR